MRMQSQDPPGDYGAPPPKPRFKHDIPIGSATVSGDRQVLVALDAEGCINGWDAATARRLYRRPALDRNEVPQRLTCSPDGRYVAASPRFLPAGIIRVFELAGGREVRRLDRGFSAVFSPDGEFLAATDGDQLRRWALKSGAELPALEPAWAPLKWAAWSPKGDLLAASADASAAVAVWNVATRQRVFPTVAGWNQSATTSLAFSPDGGTLAVGNFWGIKFWNLPGKPLQLFESHEEYSVGQLKFSADGRRMLASVRRRRLLVWDPVSGRPLFTWASYRTEDGCLEVSEGGDVAIWIEKGGIRLERIPKILAGPDDGHVIRGFCFTPEGLLVTGDDRGIVRVWDPATEKEIRRYEVPLERLRFISQGGRWATFGGEKDPVRIWDLSAGRELFQVESKEPVSAIALSPDGTAMALGFVDGSVSIRDLAGAKERARIRQELAGVTAIAWSADGKSLGWGDDVGAVVIAEGTRGQDPVVFRPRENSAIRDLAFSPDGKTLQATNRRGFRRLYSGDPGIEPLLAEVEINSSFNSALPNNRWNASGFLQKRELRGYVRQAFSPDGAYAVDVTTSGSMLIWQAPGGK